MRLCELRPRPGPGTHLWTPERRVEHVLKLKPESCILDLAEQGTLHRRALIAYKLGRVQSDPASGGLVR
jgi:hypothetical protein